jgi:hypothetical protein
MNRALVALLLVAATSTLQAQTVDRYFPKSEIIGHIPMTFPGPAGGNTFLHLPVKEVKEWGDTSIATRAFLLDLNISNDGIYLSPDTVLNVKGNTPFEFIFSDKRRIHAALTPTHAHEDFAWLDTTYSGTLGYGLLKQFVSQFDFKTNTLSLYPLYSKVELPSADSVIELPFLDDAKITYCGCNFPTLWADGDAPPFKPGHVHIAFEEPLSQIYNNALDKKTDRALKQQYLKDSTEGVRRPLGFNLGQFYLKTTTGQSENLAKRSPHRTVSNLPKQYHDLNVPLLGSLGTDFLRTFSAVIIDPSGQRILLIR